MKNGIKLWIASEPVAKQSFKFTQAGIRYTPKNIKDYAGYLKWSIKSQLNDDFSLLDEPIDIKYRFIYLLPKSSTKKQKTLLMSGKTLFRDKKPDFDNLCKNVNDAMNGIIFRDDAQIVRATIEKIYGEETGVEIIISKIEEVKSENNR